MGHDPNVSKALQSGQRAPIFQMAGYDWLLSHLHSRSIVTHYEGKLARAARGLLIMGRGRRSAGGLWRHDNRERVRAWGILDRALGMPVRVCG